MIRATLIAYLAMAAGAPASEDHELDAYGPVLFQCYAEAEMPGARATCIGTLSEACRAGEEQGETTIGIVSCALAELRAWDGLLNEEYKATRAWAAETDALNSKDFPEFANLADSLLQAQRAWIAFRDAECGLAYALWGSGSMRNIASANCRMSMTAERTIHLREMRGEP